MMRLSKNEKVLFALGIGLVLVRFVAIGIVPFLIDEPLFQVWAQEMIHDGKFRLVAMGGSSLPVSYGGGAIWLYAIPSLITNHPMGFVLFHTLIYSTGFFTLFLTLRKFYGNKPALYCFLLAASSPFLFFFSRHAWDTTFYMPMMSACLWILACLSDEKRLGNFTGINGILWPILALGALLALAINIQLSCGPFILTIGLGCLFLWWREKGKSKQFLGGIVFLVILVIALITPYLLEAWHVQQTHPPLVHKKINEHWGTARHLWWNILYSFTWLSTWHAGIFWEPVNQDFNALTGAFFTKIFKLDLFGWILKIFTLAGLLYPIIGIFMKERIPFFTLVGTIGFTVSLLVFQFLNIPMQPHYFQSFWWLPFTGLAAIVFSLNLANKGWLQFLVAGAVVTNVSYLIFSLIFLIQNTGTRGLHHGTGILEVRRAVSEMCEEGKRLNRTEISLDVAPIFTPDNAIKYFFDRNDTCRGVNLLISRLTWPNSDARLVYDSSTPTSARLVTEWKK